jgi:hypothetical protein
MRSSSAPDSDGFGDHPDQYTGDPVWRLRVPGARAAPWQDRALPAPGRTARRAVPLPAGRSGKDMPGQETCAPPVIVTLPAQINAATAEQAAEQINAAFTPGVTVVIADLTSTTCRDCSAIRHLLRAHRKATARGGQVRFAIRPGGPLHRITEFADIHPLLAVYPTLQRAIKADYPSHPAIARRSGGHHHLIAI